jgi:succinate dehydrogenase/fumarate reductase flavoprotein subunit
MNDEKIRNLATDVVARLKAARAVLLSEMEGRGLSAADGWRIVEELRHTIEGTEWTFRPVHLRERMPDLSQTVVIDHEGRPV